MQDALFSRILWLKFWILKVNLDVIVLVVWLKIGVYRADFIKSHNWQINEQITCVLELRRLSTFKGQSVKCFGIP